ncbi:MAG: hypothetical protein HC862_31015 [Scytonema sp. RU_4_4]|nr:hypothetical protein [Scytonema sp. RU_4_4]
MFFLAVNITALGLLDLVYFCNVLSMGQLPFQVFQRQVLYLGKPQDRTGSPVRIMLCSKEPPFRGNVSLDNVVGRYFPNDTGLTL